MNNSIAVIHVREVLPDVIAEEKALANHNKDNAMKDASYWNSLYSFVVLGASILNAAVLTTFPRENSILHQECWYQGLILIIFGIVPRYSIFNIVMLFIFTKERYLITMAYFSKIFLAYSLSYAVLYSGAYAIWTLKLGYNHPLPYIGLIVKVVDLMVNCFGFWFLIPSELRSQHKLNQQAKGYLKICAWTFFQTLPFELISAVADTRLQWILCLLIPLLRASVIWVDKKIVQRIPETNTEGVFFQ